MADLQRRIRYTRKAKENTFSYQELEKKADQLVKEDRIALVSYLRSPVARALHRHRKGAGSIPAGGPIVDEFFSTVPGLNLDMCIIFHSK